MARGNIEVCILQMKYRQVIFGIHLTEGMKRYDV